MPRDFPEFHPVFGRLEHDDELNTYQAKVALGKKQFSIRLEMSDDGDYARAEERAIRFMRDAKVELEAARRYLAGHYLDLANEDWSEGDQERMSVKEFLSRIEPEDVLFNGDGGVELTFRDGEVFAGHWLIARIRPDGILFDHELAG